MTFTPGIILKHKDISNISISPNGNNISYTITSYYPKFHSYNVISSIPDFINIDKCDIETVFKPIQQNDFFMLDDGREITTKDNALFADNDIIYDFRPTNIRNGH
jgi:hypothetical protein